MLTIFQRIKYKRGLINQFAAGISFIRSMITNLYNLIDILLLRHLLTLEMSKKIIQMLMSAFMSHPFPFPSCYQFIIVKVRFNPCGHNSSLMLQLIMVVLKSLIQFTAYCCEKPWELWKPNVIIIFPSESALTNDL